MALVSFLGQHIFSECTEIGLAPYCLCGSRRRLWSNTYLESYAVDCMSGCISCRINSDFDNSVHRRGQKSQRVHSVTAKSTQMLSGWPRSEHSIFSLRAHGHVFDRIGGHLLSRIERSRYLDRLGGQWLGDLGRCHDLFD